MDNDTVALISALICGTILILSLMGIASYNDRLETTTIMHALDLGYEQVNNQWIKPKECK